MIIKYNDKWVINKICDVKASRCNKTDFISHCAGLWIPGKRGYKDRKMHVKEACVWKLISWTTASEQTRVFGKTSANKQTITKLPA